MDSAAHSPVPSAAPILVSGALIVRERRLLLGRRSPHRRICPNTWDTIGGHVEAGETLEAALVRELMEEIGVVPTRFSPLAMIDFGIEAGRPVHFHVFKVEAFTGEPHLANAEHTELRWFTPREALALADLASPHRYPPVLRLAFDLPDEGVDFGV
jgi:mutator protein MutT